MLDRNTRKIFIFGIALLLVFCLNACSTSTSMSYTYIVDTGNTVKVTLDTTESDYKIKPDESNFILYNDEQIIAQGCFTDISGFEYYVSAAHADENVTVLEDTGNKVIYMYNDDEYSEYDLIMNLNNKTCVIIGSLLDDNITQDIVKDVLSRLTFNITK